MGSADDGHRPGWWGKMGLGCSDLRLEDRLRKQGHEAITAGFSGTLDFNDVLGIATTSKKVGTDSGNVWLGLDLPPASAEDVDDSPLKYQSAKCLAWHGALPRSRALLSWPWC
jgi:hypothetical protein